MQAGNRRCSAAHPPYLETKHKVVQIIISGDTGVQLASESRGCRKKGKEKSDHPFLHFIRERSKVLC